jgi:hypothetical protein
MVNMEERCYQKNGSQSNSGHCARQLIVHPRLLGMVMPVGMYLFRGRVGAQIVNRRQAAANFE